MLRTWSKLLSIIVLIPLACIIDTCTHCPYRSITANNLEGKSRAAMPKHLLLT